MRLTLRAQAYRLNRQLARLRPRDAWLLAGLTVLLVAGLQLGIAHLAGWTGGPDIEARIAEEKHRAVQLNNELVALRQQQENPRARELAAQIARLEGDTARIDQRIADVTDNLISPDQMVPVLRNLLADQTGLSLRRLETLPMTTTAGETPDAADGTQVYRHAITLELEGSFNAVANYLRSVEQSEFRVYWSAMEYSVEAHPTGRMTLTLYTLSAQEGWLNV